MLPKGSKAIAESPANIDPIAMAMTAIQSESIPSIMAACSSWAIPLSAKPVLLKWVKSHIKETTTIPIAMTIIL
jgi:hypothetical protein